MDAELWGEVHGVNTTHRQFGKGQFMNRVKLEEIFEIMDIAPDCKLPEDNSIHYGHRTLDGIDIYFISNQEDEVKEIYPEFRVKGKQPELWDATTGSIRDLPAYEQKKESTLVPIKLAPYESAFVVFRNPSSSSSLSAVSDNYPQDEVLEELNGPWGVSFESSRRGPAEPVVFETLQDWTTSSDNRIKYYSGEATYFIQFNLLENQEEENIIIDLVNLTAMAKVTVNGEYVGGSWTPPYRLDITDQVKTGDNELTITVVNNWMNRIIGDLNLPESQRETWYLVNPHNAQTSLQPSGLFGPVTINKVQY